MSTFCGVIWIMYTLRSFKVPMVHLSPGWTEGPVEIKKPEGTEKRGKREGDRKKRKVEGSHINLNASMCHFRCKIEVISTSTELHLTPPLHTIYLSSVAHLCQPALHIRKWIRGDTEGRENVFLEISGERSRWREENTSRYKVDNPVPALLQISLICDVKGDGGALYYWMKYKT